MARLAVEERRALLLQAAARVIARVGVSDATTRAIADEAGMSQGAFHYCFRSKDELLRQMLTDLLDHLDRRARNALDATRTSASAGAALRDGLRTLWSELASRENENLVLYELTVVALRSPELNDLPAQQYERYFSIMEQFLRDVAERWNITWTRPVERLARFAVAGIDGLGLSWLVTRDDDTVTGVLHDIACHLQEHAAPAPEQGRPNAGRGLALLTEPEVTMDRDREVTLDGRTLREIRAEVDQRTETRQRVMRFNRSANGESFSPSVLVPSKYDSIFAAPTRKPATGTFEYRTVWRLGKPQLDVEAGGKRLGEALVQSGSDLFTGRKRMALVSPPT